MPNGKRGYLVLIALGRLYRRLSGSTGLALAVVPVGSTVVPAACRSRLSVGSTGSAGGCTGRAQAVVPARSSSTTGKPDPRAVLRDLGGNSLRKLSIPIDFGKGKAWERKGV